MQFFRGVCYRINHRNYDFRVHTHSTCLSHLCQNLIRNMEISIRDRDFSIEVKECYEEQGYICIRYYLVFSNRQRTFSDFKQLPYLIDDSTFPENYILKASWDFKH